MPHRFSMFRPFLRAVSGPAVGLAALILAVPAVLATPALLSTPALAQNRLPEDPVAPVEFTPDDTILVERYVREAVDVPIVEEHMTLRPGSVIPAGVPLRVFGEVSALRRFVYFVSVDDKIVIADPQSRVVVRIIDKKS